MQEVGGMESASPENGRRDRLRIKQGPAGDEHKRHEQVHDEHIAELLQRVELVLCRYGEGRLFIAEDPECIILGLLHQTLQQSFEFHLVVASVVRDQVSKEKKYVVDGKDDPGYVMERYGGIEFDEGDPGTGKLHAEPRDDQDEAEQGVDCMPDADPGRIQV